jgi:hypothetical protein
MGAEMPWAPGPWGPVRPGAIASDVPAKSTIIINREFAKNLDMDFGKKPKKFRNANDGVPKGRRAKDR